MCTNCTHFVFVRIFVLDILFLFTRWTLIVLCTYSVLLTTLSRLVELAAQDVQGLFSAHGADASKF